MKSVKKAKMVVKTVKTPSECKMAQELKENRIEMNRLRGQLAKLRAENADLKIKAEKFKSLVGSWKAFIHQVWS